MDVKETLNQQLLNQSFEPSGTNNSVLEKYQKVAHMYSEIENAIVVLSDLKTRKSYIYLGHITNTLGLSAKKIPEEIASIWEGQIFEKIHLEDLTEKHLLELCFLKFLKEQPILTRSDFYILIKLRIRNRSGVYISISHRMFYAFEESNMRLALCVYSFTGDSSTPLTNEGVIVNSATGESIKLNSEGYNEILSPREKEVLKLIGTGKMSKEIASLLYISINTVNRHRQNILEKLNVKNSIEAFRIADKMGLI